MEPLLALFTWLWAIVYLTKDSAVLFKMLCWLFSGNKNLSLKEVVQNHPRSSPVLGGMVSWIYKAEVLSKSPCTRKAVTVLECRERRKKRDKVVKGFLKIIKNISREVHHTIQQIQNLQLQTICGTWMTTSMYFVLWQNKMTLGHIITWYIINW